jgi:hypothetical protein
MLRKFAKTLFVAVALLAAGVALALPICEALEAAHESGACCSVMEAAPPSSQEVVSAPPHGALGAFLVAAPHPAWRFDPAPALPLPTDRPPPVLPYAARSARLLN